MGSINLLSGNIQSERQAKEWLEQNEFELQDLHPDPDSADFLAYGPGKNGEFTAFAVEVKFITEGRLDRVLPLLSMAVLQATKHSLAHPGTKPMAIVCVDRYNSALFKKVLEFADRYAADVALGVFAADRSGASPPKHLGILTFGGRAGVKVDESNELGLQSRLRQSKTLPSQSVNLFSDLNQWMLKVLLAPEIPDALLKAPRGEYCKIVELATASGVTEMSVSRFLKQLKRDGFLDEFKGCMVLVRRNELFAKWASAQRAATEVPMRFLFRSNVHAQLKQLVDEQDGKACMGLFAAADALNLGHVSGVPPYVCVDELPVLGVSGTSWQMVTAITDGVPDFIVRLAPFPRSTFRGAVATDSGLATDVIQTWLDVSQHPTRGHEQADLIYRKVLEPLINAKH